MSEIPFTEKRAELELIFETYRKHKYYTIHKNDINVSITSKMDDVGGGRSNETSDPTANAAIKLVDEVREAREFVERVEKAVNQLPDLEKQVIEERYMCRNYDYINDYTVYEAIIPMSKNTYSKVRERAMKKLHIMLVGNK